MSDDAFMSALNKVTSGAMSLPELIGAAAEQNERSQPRLAQQLYRIWIGLNREHPQLYIAQFNAAVVCTNLGDVPEAVELLKAAILANGDFLPAYINLGGLLERGGAANDAIELWKTAITRLQPITGQAVGYKLATLKQLGRVLGEHQKLDTAEIALQECLTLNPSQRDVMEQFISLRLGQCKWPVIAPFEGVDRKAQISAIHPLSMAAYTDDPLLQLATSWRYSQQLVDEDQDLGKSDRRHAPIDLRGRRIRVGYVSSDLRDHAIGYLMAELFELHDKEKVEVFAYYCGRPSEGEGLQKRIKGAIEHWVDIREMTDDQAAAKIAADGIDILVDVNGHTRDARTGVFARRPAPIQVNWLGFPSTMGSPYHQYIIADDWIIPEGSEIFYSEKVLRLPCYQSNDRKRTVAERPTRASAGLPEDAFVFCCFNGLQKINAPTFARWMEILKRTPDSVLWLLEGVPEANERLAAAAEAHGIDRARIVFAPKLANPWHLARYPLADLFLDTVPYGAHTTCSDALWMGVPIVSLSGKSFASRVCGSLLRAAGLPELVVETPQAYVDLAVSLAHDRKAVDALKARLEAGRSTCVLFDMDLLTGELEGLYARMCAEYAAGETPQPDLANLEVYRAIGVALDHEGQEMLVHPDYLGFYKSELARKHRVRPLIADTRLWTAADIAAADANPALEDEPPARLRRAANA
jgi:predicted O-linked N-acetylglucosamine transferase (SPINDLY family)